MYVYVRTRCTLPWANLYYTISILLGVLTPLRVYVYIKHMNLAAKYVPNAHITGHRTQPPYTGINSWHFILQILNKQNVYSMYVVSE